MHILFNYENKSLSFDDPISIIKCSSFNEVPLCFDKIEEALQQGLYIAGFFSYELGYAFEEKFWFYEFNGFPLLYIGCYEKPQLRKHFISPRAGLHKITNQRLNISREKYFDHIQTIRSYLKAGDVYQITYCLKILFDFGGDAFDLYKKLFDIQPVPYAVFVETDQYSIASLSPELFLQKRGRSILSKPMKGTWPRGKTFFSDIAEKQKFYHDEKNRSENVMITDLLRNDLGRIGKNIHVPRLWEVTPYKTLFQMTSTVAADVAADLPLYDLFKSLFPSGSVTGAPKIRAMEVIHELEQEPRNIYTGAIGYITPDKDLFFNIPIRTALINRANGRGEMGIGGGIVWDSTPEGEWAEGILKARFFTDNI